MRGKYLKSGPAGGVGVVGWLTGGYCGGGWNQFTPFLPGSHLSWIHITDHSTRETGAVRRGRAEKRRYKLLPVYNTTHHSRISDDSFIVCLICPLSVYLPWRELCPTVRKCPTVSSLSYYRSSEDLLLYMTANYV